MSPGWRNRPVSLSIFDAVGAVGVMIIIVTYLLLQTGKMESRGIAYSAFNAFGSAMIIVSLWFDFNLAAFIVEFFWLVISIYGILKSVPKSFGR